MGNSRSVKAGFVDNENNRIVGKIRMSRDFYTDEAFKLHETGKR